MTVHSAQLGQERHFGFLRRKVGQLGPSVDVVDLLAHGCHQSVLLVAVVGPVTNIFK